MKWILALSVGPVAGFIAAGRRSRDIWYGSSWLSETTREVAKYLRKSARAGMKVELLLPSEKRLGELEEAYKATQGLHGGRVSNKVLAQVELTAPMPEAQAALRSLMVDCCTTARAFLLGELERIREHKLLRCVIDAGAFKRQEDAITMGDFLELSAAWVPLVENANAFGGAVKEACDLRDATPKLFVHPTFSRRGVERSDLDEGRDTVLHRIGSDDRRLRVPRAQAGLIESEELDAIGLLRRAGPYLHRTAGETKLAPLPFPPTACVAVDPWLEGATAHRNAGRELQNLRKTIEAAENDQEEDFFIWCSRWGEPGRENARFAYDASMLLEGSAEALREGARRVFAGSDVDEAQRGMKVDQTLHTVTGHVRRLHREIGAPIPYYALFELDGDGVGRLLADQGDHGRYSKLVEALDAFAGHADGLVKASRGTALYVAGDEVLAYVPLDEGLGLIRELSKAFQSTLADAGFPGRTVSAGAVFAHVKDDLRGVRKAAHEGLKRAKEVGRAKGVGDHVCVREMPRTGADREIVGRISAVHESVDALLGPIREGHISLRTEQHLRDHHDRFAAVSSTDAVHPGVRLAQDAVRRQFERAGRDDAKHPLTARISELKTWNQVNALADEIRIASRIADVRAQRGSR